MANNIGRFEILSEISHSDSTSVYKANDPTSSQTVALKVINCAAGRIGFHSGEKPTGRTSRQKVLNSQNIGVLYGSEEVDGFFVPRRNMCRATV